MRHHRGFGTSLFSCPLPRSVRSFIFVRRHRGFGTSVRFVACYVFLLFALLLKGRSWVHLGAFLGYLGAILGAVLQLPGGHFCATSTKIRHLHLPRALRSFQSCSKACLLPRPIFVRRHRGSGLSAVILWPPLGLQDGFRRPQSGPKRPPGGPKMAPRWPQDGPKMAQMGRRWAQGGSKITPR